MKFRGHLFLLLCGLVLKMDKIGSAFAKPHIPNIKSKFRLPLYLICWSLCKASNKPWVAALSRISSSYFSLALQLWVSLGREQKTSPVASVLCAVTPVVHPLCRQAPMRLVLPLDALASVVPPWVWGIPPRIEGDFAEASASMRTMTYMT